MKDRYILPLLLLVFVVLAAGIVTAGCLFYRSQHEIHRIDTSDVVASTAYPSTDAGAVSTNVLKVALTSMLSPDKTRQKYEDLLRLIGQRVGRPVEIVQRKTYAEVNALLERKTLDFALVCSGPYTEGKRKFGMELLVVPVAYGKRVYYSYIIASAAGKIEVLDDLRGKRFAFVDPDSNSGCTAPCYMLGVRGETPQTFFKSTSYTYSHDNSIRAVAEGVADGAAVDSLIWEYLNAREPARTSQTRVIEKSPPYGIPPFVVHPSLDPWLKSALKHTFLNIHKDTEGAALLKKMGIDRFEEGDDAMYDSVRAMLDWLDRHPAAQPPNVNRGPR